MAKKIHFQDNLFQLARILDTLNEGLLLDLDQKFFASHYIDQIQFIDSVLNDIGKTLIENPQFIEHSQQMRNLYSVEKKIIELGNLIRNSALYVDFETPAISSMLSEIAGRHNKILQSLNGKISEIKEEENSQDVVSHEEMSQLLGF